MTTESQLHLLHHTLGLSERNREPYRNHFVAGHGHHDMPDLEALKAEGLMSICATPKFCDPEDIVYFCTAAGKQYALDHLPPEPKRTRYDDYQHSEISDSFGEYLCGWKLPRYESTSDYDYVKGKTVWKYRMSRGAYSDSWYVTGQWASTKKEAKASYKAALAAASMKEAA